MTKPESTPPNSVATHRPDGRHNTVSVAAALRVNALAVGAPEVVAGEMSLDREVRRAHAGEVPNVASLLRGGELLLTTGMGLKPDARTLNRYIVELSDRGVAGLVLELGTAFHEVPAAMASAAAEHELPLIVLHREVPFVEVVEQINHGLFDQHLLRVERADAIFNRLTTLTLDGAGVPEVLGEVAAIIENPVLLERENGELLFHAVFDSDSGDVLAAWDAVRRELPGAVASVTVPLPIGREAARGQLVAVAIDSELNEMTELALERAGGLVALLGRQLRQEEMLAARERGNLLEGLLAGDAGEREIQRQVEAMGFPRRVPYLMPCVLAGLGADRVGAQGARATAWSTVWREVRRELESQVVPVLGGLMSGDRQIACVVGLSSPKQREDRATALTRLFSVALDRQFGTADAGLLFVGGPSPSWTGAISGLAEVVEAAASPRPETRGWYDATRPDLQRLLWRMLQDDHTALTSFAERRLSALDEHDRDRNSKLIATLEAYLAAGGRKVDAARALHLERQSLYHRISRIESLIGGSLDDEDTRLGLHLAIRLRRLMRPR